jgi:hypothetical protein
MLPEPSYCKSLNHSEVSIGIHLIVPSTKTIFCDVHEGTIHILLGSTTPFDIRKRKRSLCKVGLIAISTSKIAITLADVKIKA